MKGKSGRKPREDEVKGVFVRLPPALLARVEHCHWLLQRQRGPKVTQTTAFWDILEAGCEALEQTLEGREARAPAQTPISKISEISSDDLDMPGYGFPGDEETPAQPVAVPQTVEMSAPKATRSAPHALPREKLQAIADERTLCEGLSLREFSRRLFDKGVYRARDRKTGEEKPGDPTQLGRWLKQAHDEGML
jgi:hypothetical protein